MEYKSHQSLERFFEIWLQAFLGEKPKEVRPVIPEVKSVSQHQRYRRFQNGGDLNRMLIASDKLVADIGKGFHQLWNEVTPLIKKGE